MNRRVVLGMFVAVVIALLVHRTLALEAVLADPALRVALVRTPIGQGRSKPVEAAYDETFQESGIPYTWIASTDLSLMDASTLASRYRALVFVDGLNERLPEEATGALTDYVRGGGYVAVVADAGARNLDGTYRSNALLTGLDGVQSIRYSDLRGKAFGSGNVQFTSAAAGVRWDVPAGKLASGLRLAGYGYGPLTYPYPRSRVESSDVRVEARAGSSPVIAERTIGKGEVTYVALPLGFLRDQTDGFPLRMLLAHFLLDSGAVPHLIASPDGVGQLVIDFHIDSAIEWKGIPNLKRRGFLRHSIPMEFDITAGPDRDRIGDGLGFDACGRGRALTLLLAQYGTIGSHGGWAHNLFAKGVETRTFTDAQVQKLIARNDACLESVLHRPVLSYAAPAGAHPQPSMTKILRTLGVDSYYYTGDTGAPIERPFADGNAVSAHSWAFPVMPLDRLASIGEMDRAHVPPPLVRGWLETTADYAAAHHAIYLVYSHSYDLLNGRYAGAFGAFLDHVEQLKGEGRLQLTSMPAAAAFMNRFVATKASFTRTAGGLRVHLENPAGLRSIAFAVPSELAKGELPPGLRDAGVRGNSHVYSVRGEVRVLDVTLGAAR